MYELIKTRFGKAAQHYDTHAVAQKQISEKLFSLIASYLKETTLVGTEGRGNFLEIGCGTGNLSHTLLSLSPNKLILNDICSEYLPVLEKKLNSNLTLPAARIHFTCGDAGELIRHYHSQHTPPFRLIASASAIQWIEKPLEFLTQCKEIMEPNGLLAISTFAPDNLHPVNCITGCSLNYPSLEEIRIALEPHYTMLHLSCEEITLSFRSPKEVLQHLKLTGVNGVGTHQWTKKDLDRFTALYQQHRTAEGSYPLSYRPIFIIGRNPKNHK